MIVWLALLSLGLLAQASSLEIIDSDETIESIAKVVCETTRGTSLQLSRISTISRLVEFLASKSEEDKSFYQCRFKYLESLVELDYLMANGNEDVCGEEKLDLIERYHRRFVSRVDKFSLQIAAPKLANHLFMHYAKKVSSVCEQSALEMIERTRHETKAAEHQKQLDKMRQFTDALGMSDLSRGYNSIYMFWSLVDSLPLEQDAKISRYLSKRGETRVNIQMGDARPVQALQALCRYKFSPLYSRSILPVLRLADLGYYPAGSQLVTKIAEDQYTTGLFISTQMCEIMRRIKVFEDKKLEGDKIVAIPLEEAEKLPIPAKLHDLDGLQESQHKMAVEKKSLADLDQLVAVDVAQQDVEKIKSSIKSRAKLMNRVLKTLLSNVKGIFKSETKNLYLKKQSGEPVEELQAALDDSMKDVVDLKVFNEESSDDEDENSDKSPARKRRSIKDKLIKVGIYILSAFLGVLWLAYIVALFCIKFAVLIVPTVIVMLLNEEPKAQFISLYNPQPIIEDDSPVIKAIAYLWTVGWDPLRPLSTDYTYQSESYPV